MEHSWECVAQLLRGGHTEDILCDVGMPVIHRGALAALFFPGVRPFVVCLCVQVF